VPPAGSVHAMVGVLGCRARDAQWVSGRGFGGLGGVADWFGP